MDMKKMTEMATIAKSAVQDLDEPYKSIAFRVFLDKLLSEDMDQTIPKQSHTKATSTKSEIESENAVDIAFSKIDRTKHPEIGNLKTAKDQALLILKIAKDEATVDGLSPNQISQILDKIFRLKASRESISMALGRETKLVDRKPIMTQGVSSFVYRIMAPGEDYLSKIIAGKNTN